MRTIVLSIAALSLAAATGHAYSISLGSASGAPGETVNISATVSPSIIVGGFEFAVTFDDGLLEFSGFSLSSEASGNNINVDTSEPYSGRAEIEGDSSSLGKTNEMGRVGSLRFKINPGSPRTTAQIELDPRAKIKIGKSWSTATTGSDGTVTIEAPITPTPAGPPPELTLTMDSPREITYGEEPLLHYLLELVDPAWEGWPADAYLGVSTPGLGFYYIDNRLRFTQSRRRISSSMPIEEMDGGIGFGPLPAYLPIGRYTFYGVLTFVGMDPRKKDSRITALEETYFYLVPAPTPTPTPPAP